MKLLKLITNTKASLITLCLGGISLGMTEFMMMGVLPDVARSLKISIPEAGNLITVYALGVIIGAPVMVGILGKYPPKKVLMALMLIVALGNILFSIAPTYELLIVARLLVGLPHGAFFGIGAVVAARLADPGSEAKSVSVMFAGLTIANIFGVPLGTFIGHNLDWRISFMVISAIAIITVLSIKRWLPALPSQSDVKFSDSLKVFKKAELWIIIAISAIGTGGLFAWISYIAPLMTEVAHFSGNMITPIMIIAGLGMAVGNFIGGRLADKFSPLKTTAFLLLAMVFTLVLVAELSQFKAMALLLTFITGALAFAVIAPMQMLMIGAAKGAEMLASSAMQASANTGNALGAFLGGIPIAAGYGYTSPEYVGSLMALSGFALCIWLSFRFAGKAKMQTAQASV
ncbi:MFS transporter [Pedobacter antarcticus]|uniref:Membrane protein n=2 Tax=Pedobacter antarcticus TaxID=34086 RepID=A0A081PBF9_9SPHI|nr:MFS transporter [Pedobacter antarcticus]KEQ28032.1 membrane protein [Pedobacter antarcticus 4BY]SDM05188.1 MFS transporter, DHA1 family, arabinose polymer transporter [Pedobacter antarcticus]SFF27782.1 MFS transporter, DHA1 family, arabinose polymer transporter [Pedobacter antarcticus]